MHRPHTVHKFTKTKTQMSISIYELFDDYKHPSPYVAFFNRVAAKQTVSSDADDTLFLVCIAISLLYGNPATMNYIELLDYVSRVMKPEDQWFYKRSPEFTRHKNTKVVTATSSYLNKNTIYVKDNFINMHEGISFIHLMLSEKIF